MSTRRQQQQQSPLLSTTEKSTSAATDTAITSTSPKFKHKHNHNHNDHKSTSLKLLISLSLWFLSLLLFFSLFPTKSHHHHLIHHKSHPNTTTSATATCPESILPFYIYLLPPRFNEALLSHCKTLNIYTNMCTYVSHRGLGRPLPTTTVTTTTSTSTSSWFATHQFLAEMIFHARAQSHPCRTHDPARAALFYVPFYGGLYASSSVREKNLTARDAVANDLAAYLVAQPMWGRLQGRDHFLAIGRTAWDFMRPAPGVQPDYGANSLLKLAPIRNMSVLTVERHPWDRSSPQFGIPYPSYFHPHCRREIRTWQETIRAREDPTGLNRAYLFSFVGGSRPGLKKAKVRDLILAQCARSARCRLLDCTGGKVGRCFEPNEVVRVMLESEFCLQAPGDSFTRRSTFDSMLVGCVPVFFSPHTAYSQYEWYLPADPGEYSVYIDEEGEDAGRIEEVLSRVPKEKIMEMRENIIRMVPSVTYMHPDYTYDLGDEEDDGHRHNSSGIYDAVDVALQGLSRHVKSLQYHRPRSEVLI